jgi:hypothetical protein
MLKKTIILSMLLQGAAQAGALIPEQIKAPTGYKSVLTVHAKGEQIYQCTVKQGEYTWETQAPDAQLFDDQGKLVGNHSAGPVWEYKAGSRVVGRVLKKVEIQPESSISWLLVEVVSHQGDGLFSNVDFINRINTHGGLAPISPCNANHLGGEKRVAYTADYIFYAK